MKPQCATREESPRVSVVMSVYNGAQHLREAVESILAQTFSDFEFIIVDDGSTDDSAEIICSYSDPRIRLISNEANLGLPASLNRAIALARGAYIARQDADDISLPERFLSQVGRLDADPALALIGSAAFFIEFNGKWHSLFYNPCSDLDAKWRLLFHNVFSHTSVMFRREVFARLGGYSESTAYKFCEDYELWSRVARCATVANTPEPLVKWRMNPGSWSHRNVDRQRAQVATVARQNLSWVMGKEISDASYYAWRKFWLPDINAPVTFADPQIRELEALLSSLTANFYDAYALHGAAVARHRAAMHYSWARHAVALSCKPGRVQGMRARIRLFGLGLRLLLTAVIPSRSRRPPCSEVFGPPEQARGASG